MPRVAKKLSALEIKRISKKGFNAVGGIPGLGLLITPNNTKSWVYRVSYGGKRHLIGLGGYSAVSLAQAMDKAQKIRSEIDTGFDPIGLKRANKSRLISEQAKAKTFEDCAKLFLAKKVFKNIKHGKQWEATLKAYVYPYIGKIIVAEISIANIREVLDPIWHSKTETASRIQGRIKKIIDFAIVSGYRDASNPALWRGYLDSIYDSPRELKVVRHFDAMPYKKIYEFLKILRKHQSMSAKALEFLILTAVRSDSVRSAEWSQIDLESQIWTIPKAYTKTKKRDHQVPLSKESILLLKDLPKFNKGNLVFPSLKLNKMSDSTISKLMREILALEKFDGGGVPHGFRSTFSTWRLERTSYSQELGEFCLMHEVGDMVYQAYQRSDGLEKRRAIMQDWASFINKPYIDNET